MAKIETTLCDHCRRPIVDRVQSVTVTVDSFLDAAGDTDTDQRQLDLCPFCSLRELQGFLDQLDFVGARQFVERVTKTGFRDRHARLLKR
jgi:hypothetical protein